MEVYHGSTIIVEKPLVGVGRKNLDFGQGFYITDLRQQAISWASRPLNANKPKILNIYTLDKDGFQTKGYSYKHFEAYDSEWLDFVIANRKGERAWADYDIIEGGIANDRVFNTIELYSTGLITKDVALQRLQYEQPNNQICILNQSLADGYLHFMDSVMIGKEDVL